MKIWGKPMPLDYKYSKKFRAHDSYKTIIHLHKIEKRLRDEIDREQVYHWSKEEIEARYG